MELRRREQQAVQKVPVDGAGSGCSLLSSSSSLLDHQLMFIVAAAAATVGTTGYGSGALQRRDTEQMLLGLETLVRV